MTDNKNLVVKSQQNVMIQVEAANTCLAISSQLTQDVERRRFVEILKRICKRKTVIFLSVNAYLNEYLLEKFEGEWDWIAYVTCWTMEGLSTNKALPWSLGLIEKFKDRWEWQHLSRNEALPWSLALIERFEDKWSWQGL
ncbi:MAG TPA: hypothetical protein PLV16_10425, partial [Agitococcus sp.]|nr:hypothetical protein [Agitococcus sp.]